jgi:hypothetical protein
VASDALTGVLAGWHTKYNNGLSRLSQRIGWPRAIVARC